MTRDGRSVREVVYEEITLQTELPVDKLCDDIALSELRMDSLDRTLVAYGVEEQFDILIPDEAIEGWVTIGDVVGYCETAATERKDTNGS